MIRHHLSTSTDPEVIWEWRLFATLGEMAEDDVIDLFHTKDDGTVVQVVFFEDDWRLPWSEIQRILIDAGVSPVRSFAEVEWLAVFEPATRL
jgi:hypothetical protein